MVLNISILWEAGGVGMWWVPSEPQCCECVPLALPSPREQPPLPVTSLSLPTKPHGLINNRQLIPA